MADFVPTSNVSGNTTLGVGDLAIIGAGIVVGTGTASSAITGSGANAINNMGSILGQLTSVQLLGASTSFLFNQASGMISAGVVGVDTTASGTVIDNAGAIYGGAFGFEQAGGTTLTLNNSGSIVAGYQSVGTTAAIHFVVPSTVTMQNSGLIRAMLPGSFAIQDEGNSVDTITNTGSIIGKVALGGGADIFNTAAGKVAGVIDGGAGVDTLTGSAFADTILGGSENDSVKGNAGNDSLNGGAGSDHIFGGLGRDTLAGGANNDFFVFNTAPNTTTNKDTISDFSHVADTIQLENSVFATLGAPGVLKGAFLRLGPAALDADDHIIYNHATGVLSYDSNGTAAGGVQQIAVLTNKPVLALGDFVVI